MATVVSPVAVARTADAHLKLALEQLKLAMGCADSANARRLSLKIEDAMACVRSARKSAGGAIRHAQHREMRVVSP